MNPLRENPGLMVSKTIAALKPPHVLRRPAFGAMIFHCGVL
jgi:hypothetical protein